MKSHKVRQHSHSNMPYWSTCMACGKRTYANAKMAKRAARQLHDTHRDAYPCESGSGWHIGQLPQAVLRGETTRSEWYGLSAA